MLAAIESAKIHVRLSTYIFRTDEAGLQFIAALAGAHRRGVRTRVLIDGFGGGFLRSPAYHRLRNEGVPVSRFLHSTLPWKMPFLDLRLHKKSLIVDGESAFVGGLNIGAENLTARRPKARVRDVHFRLEGAIVRQIEQEFDDDWLFATGEEPISAGPAAEAPPYRHAQARAIVAGPDQEVDQLVLIFLSAINLARRSIRIATPYFLPQEQLITALQLAALARRRRSYSFSPGENQPSAGRVGVPASHSTPAGDGVSCLAKPASVRSFEIDDDRRRMEPHRQRELGYAKPSLEFRARLSRYTTRNWPRVLAEIVDVRCIRPITLEEIDERRFVVKLRDAAARLCMPYI